MEFTPTLPHQLGFLYVAFAHQTDGWYSKPEQVMVWRRVKAWTQTRLTRGEFAQLMDEVMVWYKLQLAAQHILPTVVEIAKELTDYPSFDTRSRLLALKDLWHIARADNRIVDEEREWIRTIGEIWTVPQSDIDKILL